MDRLWQLLKGVMEDKVLLNKFCFNCNRKEASQINLSQPILSNLLITLQITDTQYCLHVVTGHMSKKAKNIPPPTQNVLDQNALSINHPTWLHCIIESTSISLREHPAFLISNKQKLPVNITHTFKLKQKSGVQFSHSQVIFLYFFNLDDNLSSQNLQK